MKAWVDRKWKWTRSSCQALIDQQVQMVLEMERKLFDSLKIGSLSCDMLIEDKEINDQTIRMELEFALKELVATLQPDSTELEQLPERLQAEHGDSQPDSAAQRGICYRDAGPVAGGQHRIKDLSRRNRRNRCER